MGVGDGGWHERDDLWEAIAPMVFSPERMRAAPSETEAIVRLLRLAPPARIVDVCTGPGRHAVELARRGFEVTGIDRTPAFLAQAAEAARAAGVTVELVEADMRELDRAHEFDAALNVYTSFGYFDDPADDLRAAAAIRRCLAPGGVALFEMIGKELVGNGFQARSFSERGNLLFVEERTIEPGWTHLAWRCLLVDVGGARPPREVRMRHRLYAATELATLLRQAGFDDVALYGELDGRPYDRDARCLVAVARSPANPP